MVMNDPTNAPDPESLDVDAIPLPLASQPHGDPTRPQTHNSATNSDAADDQLCGMTHLPTGEICTLPARHAGSCDFQAKT
jgi:hypothetical protein